MTTPELITYIQLQSRKNTPKNSIIANLTKVGWRNEDIEEGFLKMAQIFPVAESSIAGKNSVAQNKDFNQPKIDKKDFYREPINNDFDEIIPPAPISPPAVKNEIPKAWNVDKTKLPVESKPKVIVNSNLYHTPTIPHINTQTNLAKNENNELIPDLIPKKEVIMPVSEEEKANLPNEQNSAETFFTDESGSHRLSEMAMMSSFPKEFLMASKSPNKGGPRLFFSKNFFLSKRMILIFILLLIAGGTFFVFKKGYINLAKIKIPFIQESSENLLLNSPNVLSSLLSYKTETKINITFTPLAEPNNKNSTLISVIGMVNQKGLPTSSGDNILTVQNTNLEGNFVTNLKNTGPILFIPIPDLNQFIVNKSKENGMIAVKEEEFDLIRPLLPGDLQKRLKNSNTHKFLSEGLSSYLDNKVIQSYKDYINNIKVKSKKTEDVQGIETYRYDLNNDLIATKKLLNQVDEIFTTNSDKTSEGNSESRFNSVTVDSFDVWISKKDDILFKYRIVFDLPFSAVKNLYTNDKGEGQVKIDWQATYYDFGVLNKIKMPEKIIDVKDFIKSTEKQMSPIINQQNILSEQ